MKLLPEISKVKLNIAVKFNVISLIMTNGKKKETEFNYFGAFYEVSMV